MLVLSGGMSKFSVRLPRPARTGIDGGGRQRHLPHRRDRHLYEMNRTPASNPPPPPAALLKLLVPNEFSGGAVRLSQQ
jgi:hypothetical protein